MKLAEPSEFERNCADGAGAPDVYTAPMIRTMMNGRDWSILAALALIWGGAFVFIGVAIFFNPLTNNRFDTGQPQEEEPPATGEARKTDSSDALASKASESFNTPAKPVNPMGGPPGGPPEELMPAQKKQPTVIINDPTSRRPQPNDSAISSQWFRENHAKQKGK